MRACRSPTSGRSRCRTASTDEQVLFLSDIFPTGYMGAEMCDIKPGDVIAVWGCGPVGQFAIASALMLGAERVIAIDRFPYRLEMARDEAGATETINYEEVDVQRGAHEMTGGRGPGRVHRRGRHGGARARDRVRLRSRSSRPSCSRPIGRSPLREAIMACRNGGTVSVIGVYGGFVDKFPLGLGDEPVADDARPASATCTATCGRCSSASRTARSIPPSSSPIACRSTMRRRATTCSSTRWTTAKKS